MDFGTMALLVGAGLLGPLLALGRRRAALLVVGELAAGIIIGRSGLGLIDPSQPVLIGLSDIGFAVLMLIAGTHLPLRAPGLRGALVGGFVGALCTGLLAGAGAWLVAPLVGIDHPALLALLLGTSSAAVVMPILGDRAASASRLVAWVLVADVVTVVAVPLVLSPAHVGTVILGSVGVVAAGVLAGVLVNRIGNQTLAERLERASLHAGWGLRLRLSLLALFVLAWIAQQAGTSVMLAGFTLGAVLAAIGEPRTLGRELIGVGEGFLVPVFFVLLGARLDVSGLVHSADALALVPVVLAGALLVHVATAYALGLGWAPGLVASAQLGVPAAVANLGLASHQLDAGQAAAVLLAAALSVGITAFGAQRLTPA